MPCHTIRLNPLEGLQRCPPPVSLKSVAACRHRKAGTVCSIVTVRPTDAAVPAPMQPEAIGAQGLPQPQPCPCRHNPAGPGGGCCLSAALSRQPPCGHGRICFPGATHLPVCSTSLCHASQLPADHPLGRLASKPACSLAVGHQRQQHAVPCMHPICTPSLQRGRLSFCSDHAPLRSGGRRASGSRWRWTCQEVPRLAASC
ncbi:hypothetical protein V8C86DRAFT_276923 [Haematococcus lacustris]